MNKKEILIVGSGFSGLLAGIMLRKANIPVKIFEASPYRQDLGGVISLFPNSLKIFRYIGIADEIINCGLMVEGAKIQDNLGNHMVNRSLGNESIYGEPTITCKRTKAHEIIYKKAIELNIEIFHGKKVFEIKQFDNKVELYFEDGSNYNGSLLIGCDGINSIVRKSVLEYNFNPKYSGLMYFCGYVENQELIKKTILEPKTHIISIGPTNFFSYCLVDNPEKNQSPTLMWYCYLSQPNRLTKEELDNFKLTSVIEKVLNAHSDWHKPIEELILNSVDIVKGNISDVVEIDKWHNDRIIVIGDAAHAMNPFFGGQGVGTAIEDAYMLARLIEIYDGNYKIAFPKLEKLRKPRTTKIASKARKNCKRSIIKYNKFLLKLRNLSFSILTYFTPESKLNEFISYDVEYELKKIK
jgi:2-polyprenyl-6-methoxyphenol hydroxylase-like FAD-dependent oxidoreductase